MGQYLGARMLVCKHSTCMQVISTVVSSHCSREGNLGFPPLLDRERRT